MFNKFMNNHSSDLRRSELYHLKPIVSKDEMSESLTSYICRLAEQHSVHTGVLFSDIFFPRNNKKYTDEIIRSGGNGFYDWGHLINGFGRTAVTYVKLLEQLTLRDGLIECTLIKYSEIISSRSLLRKFKQWCPKCYQEMLEQGSTIYDPLIWSLQRVRVCVNHKLKLLDHCPHCLKQNLIIERRSRNGYCSKCFNPLYPLTTKEVEYQLSSPSDIAVAVLIIRMLNGFSSVHPVSELPSSLTEVTNRYFKGNLTAAAKWFGFSKTTWWSWIHGNIRPSLEVITRISLLCNLTINQLIKNELQNCQLDRVRYCDLIVRKARRATSVDSEGISYQFKKVISENPVISVRGLAKKLSVDRRLLYIYYPKWSRMQTKKHKEFKRQQSRIRQKSNEKAIKDIVEELKNNNIYPAYNKVENYLAKPALFKERKLKRYFQELRGSN